MPKVRMTRNRPWRGGVLRKGEVYCLSKYECEVLFCDKQNNVPAALPVEDDLETAALAAPENAIKPRRGRPRKTV